MTSSVRAWILAITSLVFLSAGPVRAADPVPLRVAVLTIKAEGGVKQQVGDVLTEQLAAAVQARGYSVMSPQDLITRLGFERQRQLLGCTDSSCLVEVGQALGVDRLVSGTIAVIGSSVVINLVLLNNQSGAVDFRYSERVKNATDEAFLDLVPAAANALFPSQLKATPQPPPGPSGMRVAAWITLGVGVVAVATGATFFGLARGAQGEVTLGNPAPFGTLQEKVAAGKTNDVIGVTAMSVGGALAVTSILLFVLGPSTAPVVSFAPSVGGGTFVVGGSF
jgi:TolB-like protein